MGLPFMGPLDTDSLLAGSVVAKSVFAWPGLGLLAFQSLFARDLNVQLRIFCPRVLLSSTRRCGRIKADQLRADRDSCYCAKPAMQCSLAWVGRKAADHLLEAVPDNIVKASLHHDVPQSRQHSGKSWHHFFHKIYEDPQIVIPSIRVNRLQSCVQTVEFLLPILSECHQGKFVFQERLGIVHHESDNFLLKLQTLVVASSVSTKKLMCHAEVGVQ